MVPVTSSQASRRPQTSPASAPVPANSPARRSSVRRSISSTRLSRRDGAAMSTGSSALGGAEGEAAHELPLQTLATAL
jgi:hypothetical protein